MCAKEIGANGQGNLGVHFPPGQLSSWVSYSAADIRAKLKISIMKSSSSPRKPSSKCICISRRFRKDRIVQGKVLLTKAIKAQACHHQRLREKGRNPESLMGAWLDPASLSTAIPQQNKDGPMWILLFCLSPWFLDLGPPWSSPFLISMYTNFLAHKIRCGYFMG